MRIRNRTHYFHGFVGTLPRAADFELRGEECGAVAAVGNTVVDAKLYDYVEAATPPVRDVL